MAMLTRVVCIGACDLQRFFLSLIILIYLILPGCGVGDFIGAYFNTFYNARKLFTEAEAEILAPATSGGGARAERPFLASFEVNTQTKAKFTSVIEKCSKLLQYHPESRLVDDALFMIGKSYYYQNEHQSAERKFKELLSSYPESDLIYETKLLLANTYYRNNNKATAAATAGELMEESRTAGEEGIEAKAALLLAHIELENKNYKQATDYYQVAADLGETPEERSAAYRSVAEMHNLQGDFKNATRAFVRAEETSDDYVGAYRGQIGQARMLSKLGLYEESLALLDKLIQNANNREFFGEIDLEIANVYRDQQDYHSAEAQYRYVDTAYARTESAANSYYQLGMLYESKLFKYDSARVTYDRGKSEFPQAAITPLIVKRSESMNRYFTYKNEIAKYDSLQEFILRPRDSTKAISHDTTTQRMAAKDSIKLDSTATHPVAHADSLRPQVLTIPPPPMDTVQARLAFNKSELASVFYTALEVVDSARYWYQRVLADHPKSIYVPRALYTLAQIFRKDSSVAQVVIDSLQKEVINRFPESEFAAEARRVLGAEQLKKVVDPIETSYAKAEQLVQKGDVTSALQSFKGIAEQDTTSQLSAKAQYTIGWIYENVKPNPDSSAAYYRRLVRRFPNSQYATIVQPKLAEVEMERLKKSEEARKDSAAISPKQPEKHEESLNKEATPVIPPTTQMPKDSVFEERSVKQIKQRKEDDKPKP
jgi:TolA-binding protein